ncbi:aldehyde dehydrogenase [Citrobacter koseri]|uniref:Aldehyde dehydrogenase n=1 Tax=Citrobacter koseri TaxID=545 RepID=A0A2X2W958_CITKO|nr:aldehyde dehydrogenase [Citrobacter koseri]
MTSAYRKAYSTWVLGRGETVGQELAGNPKVAMVSMTGSVVAGEKNYGGGSEKHH